MPSGVYATSADEWNRHRDDIVRLYLTENRPLKEVQQIMDATFGFRATKRMYTARIKSWGVKKNYRAEEKDVLIAQITHVLANGQSVSSITWRGRDIRHHRVLRYWKARESGKGAVLACPSPDQKALNNSNLSNTEADDRSKNGLEPTCDTIASHTSATPPSSNLGIVSFRRPQDDASTATVSNPSCTTRGCPGELIFHAAASYLDSLGDTMSPMRSTFAQTPAVGSGSDGTLMEVISDSHDVSKSNKFWHDFETAVYLLQIGSFRLGWSTFHTTWEKAAEAFLSSPTTLLRKLITTLTPGGKLNKFPEVLRSVLTFIAELLRLKLGGNHPLVHICQQLQLDMHGPRTSETALCLMSDMLGRRLGPLHQETFQAQLSLIVCQRLNRDLARAEDSARSLVEKLKSSPQGAGQLLQALRKLTHVLKDLGRYDEAVAIGHRILEHELNTASHELVIYTREDLAELYRLQERLYMESWCLSEALTASQQWFGHKAAPTLHIWDKLKTSLTEQRRESEIAFWEKDGYL